MPTSSEPTRPGPSVTAMAARSSKLRAGLFESQAHHGHDGAQMLARRKFGNDAAVFAVRRVARRRRTRESRFRLRPRQPRFHRTKFRCRGYCALLWWDLDLSPFHYHLPESSIAQEPLADRAASRMLVLYRAEQRWEDRVFREFPQFLRAGRLPGAERFEGLSVAAVRESRWLFGRGGSAAGAADERGRENVDRAGASRAKRCARASGLRVRRRGSGGDRTRRIRRADLAISL